MPTPPRPSDHTLRVRRTVSLVLSSSSLVLSLLTAVPIGLVVFGVEATAVVQAPVHLVHVSNTLAIVTGATGLVCAGNLPRSGVPRPRLPVQLGVAALLTVGASTVLLTMPLLLMVVSLLVGLLSML